MPQYELRVRGMDCAEEIRVLREALSMVSGVEDLKFDLINAKLTVTANDGLAEQDLLAAVAKTGLRAEPFSQDSDDQAVSYKLPLPTLLSGMLLGAAFVLHAGHSGLLNAFAGEAAPPGSSPLYIISAIIALSQILPKALYSARSLRPDMNLLMSVAVFGAFVLGQFFEAATVSFLFALSLALESWSVSRVRHAVSELLALSPSQARVLSESAEEFLPVEQVPVGARILVLPGERIPLDATVSAGRSAVNQSPLTGESLPVDVQPGDQVLAGSINESGAIEAVSTRPAEQSAIARILRLVHLAQSTRSPSEQWVDRFSRFYTPLVMGLAVLIAVVPTLFGADPNRWFYQALVLLVIACPCALVLSTPVSIVAALSSAAHHGILIKGGIHLETFARIQALALDKTGTLTTGAHTVSALYPVRGITEERLLQIALTVESRSAHPLAKAITQYGRARGVEPLPAELHREEPGRGAFVYAGGIEYWAGSERVALERKIDMASIREAFEHYTGEGSAVVLVAEGETICGLVVLRDALRPGVAETLVELRERGVRHLELLTGDNVATARQLAAEAGIESYRAELLPEDKASVVKELARRFHSVAMVGDGVNDAPALASASVGVAMAGVSSDAAIETADIALLGSDFSKISFLRRHAQRTLGIIKFNVSAAILGKVVFMLLAVVGQATLWLAIAADMGISLFVVFNALRLLDGGEKKRVCCDQGACCSSACR